MDGFIQLSNGEIWMRCGEVGYSENSEETNMIREELEEKIASIEDEDTNFQYL